ncbi:putative cell cycle checkpoint protein Rad17 [Aspergillus lucknowensis]|uniref:Rad17 cell cycle checkpoint protein-domain-containing protein n=1 Tax=Aspergillus lucknowensis TaxID=176173 RepID=A0ABR4LXY7_9EURO
MKCGHRVQLSNDQTVRETFRSTADLDDSERRWPSTKTAATGSAEPTVEDMDHSEDLIEDDYDSYDELFTQHFADENISGAKAPYDSRDRPPLPNLAAVQNQQLQRSASTTNRFLSPSKSPPRTRFPSTSSSDKGNLPWAQRYAPINLEELAVHKRKVHDVEQWLDDALAGRAQKSLLVLKGPAGSGKTTTISLLSNKLKFSILEWTPPAISPYVTGAYISLGTQFDEFLSRGHDFSSLDLDGNDNSRSFVKGDPYVSDRRIILIEEFPVLVGRMTSILAAFRLSLLRYLSADRPPISNSFSREAGVPPIVVIVSETSSDLERSIDHLTVHQLLGHEICNHRSTTIIEFNSIAPTIMYKALDLVVRKSARHPRVAASTIQAISKTGDIRNAIASLEFVCLNNGKPSAQSNCAVKTKHRGRASKKWSTPSAEVLEEISHRKTSLGLFHAVGKIVYNKRDDGPKTRHLRLPSPPDHLRDFDRPGVSQVHVNELPDETGTDIQSFISALHENYVPSCSGPSFTECLDSCIGALSASDVLSVNRKGHGGSQSVFGIGFAKPGVGVDLIRQEELSYQIAARGLLFSLPCPVNRQISHTQHANGTNVTHRLCFGSAIRLHRHMEHIRSSIVMWTNTLLGLSIQPPRISLGRMGQATFRETTHEGRDSIDSGSSDNGTAIVTMLSRSELLLHQLPFMAKILPDGAETRSLERITNLSRTSVQNLNFNTEEGEEFTQHPISMPKYNRRVGCVEYRTPLLPTEQDGQLILSDDDIIDDDP